MTIATADKSGKPWVSPVFFAYDEDYNFYWVSYTGAKHSQNIRSREEVGVVIFDSSAPEGDGDGVYFDAVAEQLEDTGEIKRAMKILAERVTVEEFKIKDIKEVTGSSAWRIYVARPRQISKLSSDSVDGQYIDKRIDIQLR